MKRVLALAGLVFAPPVLQGALAPFLPAALRPDLALLVVFALALGWRNPVTGLALVAAGGFAVDMLSGGLLGQRALLGVLLFGAARMLSLRVGLLGPFPQMLFAGLLTAVQAVGLAALTSFFTPGSGVGLLRPGPLALQAGVNAFAAPFLVPAVQVLVGWLGGDESARRGTKLALRSYA